ncbi:tetratricopeptide repeat protein 33-like [Stegodyphus dumicola]|uniref:tetratricopeptide repeat protein 33-like n=1 Tax=Stegodyphus dumicola TaxID=202533 RepID=UPI0015B1400C|nr:tetratricopeptide repeat protein 33-like [Stegodyphus dumicola]XP_035221011.1 tetratricopeptide repeat protein 33-like [Stegodyphus dumicola]
MTTFGWKRKAGENFSKDVFSKFAADEEDDYQKDLSWVLSFKRKKSTLQENCRIKSEEYKAEGVRLAELQKFQEAVTEFDKALTLVPADNTILEMKAQALLQLNCPFPALQAAEKAVKINPRWWIGYQTLGRSQLGIGDIKMAKISFSKAIHLNPSEKELWEDDLKWTLTLLEKKSKLDNQNAEREVKPVSTSSITYDEEGYITSSEKTISQDNSLVLCRF